MMQDVLCVGYYRLLQSYIQSTLKDGQGGPEISTWEQGSHLYIATTNIVAIGLCGKMSHVWY